MKKLLLISLFLAVVLMPLFFAGSAQAQTAATGGCSGARCTYVPLEPLPGVDSTGLNFANYVSGMFRLFITLGALFSVLMLVIAGIGYMLSESGVQIDKAKKRATSALYGLLLLTACWLILYTINPNLLRFDLFTTTLNKTAGKNTLPNTQNTTGDPNTGPIIYAAPVPPGSVGNSLLITSPSSPEKMQQIKEFYDTCTNTLNGSDVTLVNAGSGATSFYCIK